MNKGETHRPHHPRLPFLATLNLPELSRLTNNLVAHDPVWPAVPTKLPSDIPKLEGKLGEDLSEHYDISPMVLFQFIASGLSPFETASTYPYRACGEMVYRVT